MRLQKHLAHAGVASRRAAEKIIADGRVKIDGRVVRDPATDVDGTERIEVDGVPVHAADPGKARVVHLLHKPVGVVSTAKDTHGRPTVVDLIDPDPAHPRLYPVGRLDVQTTGLILLTDDGDLAHRLTHPRHEVSKTYVATVRKPPVKEATLRRLRDGVRLDDGVTLPAQARALARDRIELTIREGRNQQVRRMCEAVGHPVVALERIAFGPLRLGNLQVGTSRKLTAAEVERLRAAGRDA